MIAGDPCPHPEKRRWPLRDLEGPACACGHAWAPYGFVATANLYFSDKGDPMELAVYRCRTRAGRDLDHWHTTDMAKRRIPAQRIDEWDAGKVVSSLDIQPRWNGRRRARPLTRTERRRLSRHRRI